MGVALLFSMSLLSFGLKTWQGLFLSILSVFRYLR